MIRRLAKLASNRDVDRRHTLLDGMTAATREMLSDDWLGLDQELDVVIELADDD